VYVEGLGLDAGGLGGEPFLVLSGQQSVRGLLCLLGDGMDSFRAVLGLLSSSYNGQSTSPDRLVSNTNQARAE
jgi:hypothetical protein